MSAFNDIKKAVDLAGRHIAAAKVVATDPVHLTADVIIESKQVVNEKVPIRIFTDDDGGLGVGWIPKVGSEVLIAFIDGAEDRPQIIKVQRWDYMIARKGDGISLLEFVVDNENNISLRRGNDFQVTIDQETRVNISNGSVYELDLDENGKLTITAQDDLQVNCSNAKISASGNIDLGDGGGGVVTNQSMPVCFVTGAPVPCSQTVKAKM